MTSSQLKSQVVSLELSKRLKELGVPQNSLFYWYNSQATGGEWVVLDRKGFTTDLALLIEQGNCFSAFLVGELGELLRTELTDENESDSFTLKCGNTIEFWWATFGNDEADITPQFEDASFADCLAKMLIYLLENNLLKASDL